MSIAPEGETPTDVFDQGLAAYRRRLNLADSVTGEFEYAVYHAVNVGYLAGRFAAKPPNRPKIICLCGSTRFIDVFAVMTWEIETKVGAIVIGCTMLPEWYCQERSHFAEKQGLKEQRDQHHLRKIDLADQVLILNVDGYVGESTRAELAYAREMNKTIWWLEDFVDRPAGENVFGPHHNWEIPWKKA